MVVLFAVWRPFESSSIIQSMLHMLFLAGTACRAHFLAAKRKIHDTCLNFASFIHGWQVLVRYTVYLEWPSLDFLFLVGSILTLLLSVF
jgi:hypothetical protein